MLDHRVAVIARNLPAVRGCDQGFFVGRDQLRQPILVRGHGILREQHDDVPRRLADAHVSRRAVVELPLFDAVHRESPLLQEVDRAVGRTAVDRQALEFGAARLPINPVEYLLEQCAGIERGHDEADAHGVVVDHR